MATIASAVQVAAGAFQLISESSAGERARRAFTGALVLRVVEQALDGTNAFGFVAARAAAEIDSLPRGAERSILRRLLLMAEEGAECSLALLLVDYAYELETTRRLPEADAALALARSVAADNAEIALHAGRVARKLRDHNRALELYVCARELDAAGGTISRLAAICEAVVSPDPERALARAIRGAVCAGDAEAAAVGLEERARVRRSGGKRREAARDLCMAALRFQDPVDRARVAHELADVAVGTGDTLAAREALLLAVSCGDAPQRDHAQSRLHTLSRDLGDEVGMRRWRSFKRPMLVSLSLSRTTAAPSSAALILARWREWIEMKASSEA
ncbi:hypothetical protein BH23GEM3_BH23GEM3_20550 [soil metagenome]